MDSMPTPLGDDVYAVILAGGSGTRFWPKSRHLRPKQLCRIGGQERTMLEVTLARLDGVIPPERRLIVTHQDQLALTRDIAGDQVGLVLAEPEAKNTANALALAALELAERGRRPLMVSLHADHMISDEPAFRAALKAAVEVARAGWLTLLGVVPERAEPGFGYIERGDALPATGGYAVRSFREKPERAVAAEYVASGRFYWNAGLFVWRVDVLLRELAKTLQPSLDRLTAVLRAGGGSFAHVGRGALADAYRGLPKISIDHAVLEVSAHVAVVPAAIGWQDIGSWDALSLCFPPDAQGNLAFGDALLLDCRGTTVDSDGPFVAALGLTDHVVVANGGAILVCPKDRAQDVKQVLDWLGARGRRELV